MFNFKQQMLENQKEAKFNLNSEKLSVVYQPIYYLEKNEIFGYEGLSRIHASNFSNIMELIKLAEEHHRAHDLDLLMMEKVIKNFKGQGKLFINILAKNAEETKEYLTKMIEVAANVNLSLDRVIIELSERIEWDLESLAVIKESRTIHKFLLAIDDFGAGFANSILLLNAQPDFVKIDRMIIEKIHKNERQQILVNGFMKVLKEFGAEVICEGIEEKEELETLRALGSDYGQGYYLGRPI